VPKGTSRRGCMRLQKEWVGLVNSRAATLGTALVHGKAVLHVLSLIM
jgi:hypothetical protein